MKYRFLLFATLSLMAVAGLRAQMNLSAQAQISLITAGPYQGELYSAFGHSAVRVYDPVQEMDWVYNYGVFNFNQPNFYLNFARGNLLYHLSVGHFPRFRQSYLAEGRYLHEQVLNLTAAQKQRYFQFLQHNARPENRQYRYDYFYDNCATRIRDGLSSALGDSLAWSDQYVRTGKSIRQLCDDYLAAQPWGDLGIDLCLGLPMDKKASAWEYMFLPDYLEQGAAAARLMQGDSVVPLVKLHHVLGTGASVPSRTRSWWRPSSFTYALFLLGVWLTLYYYAGANKLKIFDAILFGLSGLLGLLLLALWLFTEHRAAAYNFNLLWAFPLHLWPGIALWRNGLGKKLRLYLRFLPYAYALLLMAWLWLPQQLHTALLPLVALVALRAWHLARKR